MSYPAEDDEWFVLDGPEFVVLASEPVVALPAPVGAKRAVRPGHGGAGARHHPIPLAEMRAHTARQVRRPFLGPHPARTIAHSARQGRTNRRVRSGRGARADPGSGQPQGVIHRVGITGRSEWNAAEQQATQSGLRGDAAVSFPPSVVVASTTKPDTHPTLAPKSTEEIPRPPSGRSARSPPRCASRAPLLVVAPTERCDVGIQGGSQLRDEDVTAAVLGREIPPHVAQAPSDKGDDQKLLSLLRVGQLQRLRPTDRSPERKRTLAEQHPGHQRTRRLPPVLFLGDRRRYGHGISVISEGCQGQVQSREPRSDQRAERVRDTVAVEMLRAFAGERHGFGMGFGHLSERGLGCGRHGGGPGVWIRRYGSVMGSRISGEWIASPEIDSMSTRPSMKCSLLMLPLVS